MPGSHIAAFAAGAGAASLLFYALQRRSGISNYDSVGKDTIVKATPSDVDDEAKGPRCMSAEEFQRRGHEMVDFIVKYRQSCSALPVRSTVEPGYLHRVGLPKEGPEEGEEWDAIMDDVNHLILPGLTHWESSHFFAYFKPTASYASVLGELLCAGLNVMGFSWIASPACTELEMAVMDWLAKMLQLPPTFLSTGAGGGVIQGSAGEAVICCIKAARTRALEVAKEAGLDVEEEEEKLVLYASDQAHSIVQNGCMLLGLDSDKHLRILPTRRENDFALAPEDLRAAIEQDLAAGRRPFFAVATPGTTSSTAIDPIRKIVEVCRPHGVWVHIDAAYGGSFAICPELRHLFDGIEEADSIVVNLHKQLLVNFDAAAMWVKDRKPLLNALSLTPEYLKNKASDAGLVQDYKDWQIPLGRRFRALKVWFVLRFHGIRGLRQHLRHGVALTRRFEALVKKSKVFEVAAPAPLSLVCFSLRGGSNDETKAVMDMANETGKIFVIHTVLDGQFVIRLAVGGLGQSEADIDGAFALLEDCGKKVLQGMKD